MRRLQFLRKPIDSYLPLFVAFAILLVVFGCDESSTCILRVWDSTNRTQKSNDLAPR